MASFAGIKNVMQREIFSNEERLLSVLSVNKSKSTGRKKKTSFLTLSVILQQGSHPVVRLSRVKPKESLNSYKRVRIWSLDELKLVDCHFEGPEVDFKFEKQIFKWVALEVAEKKSFIVTLLKTVNKYHDRFKTKFINVDEGKLRDLFRSSSTESKGMHLEDSVENLEEDEYRELSSQEEDDLEALLKTGRENAIQDAVAFMENLSEELSQLDQSNIHSLMGSEKQIEQLMEYLEGGIMEVEKMEMQLNVYDELLASVRDTMQKLSFQYSHILRQNANLKSLCDEVDDLVTKLDLDSRVTFVLQECPLGSSSNVQDCVAAAQTLQQALCQELSQGLSILQAVTDQNAFFSNLSQDFGKRLQVHLTSQFTHEATIMTDSVHIRHASSPTLASHSSVHNDLLMYSELTKWLKECQPECFSEVMGTYVRMFHHVYEVQLKGLLKDSREVLQLVRSTDAKKLGGFKITGSTVDIRSPIGGSLSSLSPARGLPAASQSIADFGGNPSLSGLYQEPSRGPTFDKVFPLVLEQIQPVCVAEQKFLNAFFHFEKSENLVVVTDASSATVSDDESDIKPLPEIICGDTGSQHLLNQLFSALLPEVEEFIDFGEKQDSYNALYLLVFVSQRLIFAEESGGMLSYLDETLKKALLHIRRLFDRFIEEKGRQISEVKIPRGSKCGTLPCVRVFEEFAERAERIVMVSDRRTELDKAYIFLIDTLFKTVERVALDHPKTPSDVIKFENYNRIVDILSRLKIVCLEKNRDEARKKYRSHKTDYVNRCLGRPLDKLSVFFDGVEKLRASGTKAEEVGFRLEYSKTELKKCIREYPGKEVKRGLEKLYRRVEKEVSDGELQVVWGNMQSAFIQQCVKFQELIEECYPNSNIYLDFSVSDLMEYFTSISRSV